MLYTIVQRLHKLQLDIIRFIWMMELLTVGHSGEFVRTRRQCRVQSTDSRMCL